MKPIPKHLQYDPSSQSLGDGSNGVGLFGDAHLLASVAVVVLAIVIVIIQCDNNHL